MSLIHLKEFEYFEPTTIEEASKMLENYGDRAQVLAGGIDLVPRMRTGSIDTDFVINIQNIPELTFMSCSEETGLQFGAMTKLNTLDKSQDLKRVYPIIQKSINQITSVQSKYMGTAVGNICLATPASDVATSLMAQDAELLIAGVNGRRTEKIYNFYKDYHKTTLERGEFVIGVNVPKPLESEGAAFYNRVRTHADIAKITVAVVLSLKDNICSEIRIALGAIAPTVIRAYSAEDLVKGKEITPELIKIVAEEASRISKPITDFRSTEEYRVEMARVLVGRGIEKAAGMARRANND